MLRLIHKLCRRCDALYTDDNCAELCADCWNETLGQVGEHGEYRQEAIDRQREQDADRIAGVGIWAVPHTGMF